jgi:hypothetical protein
MASLILECPHCGAEKIGFHIIHDTAATVHPPDINRRYRSVLVCSNCEEEVIAIFDHATTSPFLPNGGAPQQCHIDPRQQNWALVRMYPMPQASKCPDHTPDNLKRIFLQASDSLKRNAPDASGAMSRKVVDVSTQQMLGDEAKKHGNIQGRIDALASRGKLTEDLKNWAHEIRLGGNDAAHDIDPFTMPEAEELLDFAELYLTYVYSLPNRLAERRSRTVAAKKGLVSN